jgi:uncharacterized iron-regulated protein
MRFPRFWFALALAFSPSLMRGQDAAASFEAVDLDTSLPLDRLAAQLATKRVVFIGENHDRYDHHLNQLEIIRRLYQLDPNLAIGVEYFPQAAQPQLDDYIGGRTTEQEFLRVSGYYANWGYDYRLYAPIFRYAREQRIPVRALNVPSDLPSTVAKVGMAGLTTAQRALLPKEFGPADNAYRSRLRAAFEGHKTTQPGAFDRFVEAQLVWDEGMADSASAYVTANPGRRLVVLAGSGHLVFGSGIPQRLERRTHVTYAIVLNGADEVDRHMADYLVLGDKQQLPPAGVLGVSLEEKNGEGRIRSLTPNGAAAKAGLKPGDILTDIDGQPVKSVADMHLALWDKKPGDRVRVTVRRKRALPRIFNIDLAAPGGGA